MNLAKTIRDFREKRKMSQAELATAAGLSTPYISQVETGKKSPTLTSLQKISKALDVPFPILSFMSMDNTDVAEEKQEAFKLVRPAVQAMIEEFFVPE
jgi:transcriptional regulator with XRE-family HTH domain